MQDQLFLEKVPRLSEKCSVVDLGLLFSWLFPITLQLGLSGPCQQVLNKVP